MYLGKCSKRYGTVDIANNKIVSTLPGMQQQQKEPAEPQLEEGNVDSNAQVMTSQNEREERTRTSDVEPAAGATSSEDHSSETNSIGRPMFLCIREIHDSTQDENWRSSSLISPKLTFELGHIHVSVRNFYDQEWGHSRAQLALALYNESGKRIFRQDLFGIYRTEEFQSKFGDDEPFAWFDSSHEIVARAQPGYSYKLQYIVGGGAGGYHELHLQDFVCKLFPKGMKAELETFEHGGKGRYLPSKDGQGLLVYNQGLVCVYADAGEDRIPGVGYYFANHAGGRQSDLFYQPTCYWQDSQWITNVPTEMAEKFPLQVDQIFFKGYVYQVSVLIQNMCLSG